MPTAEQRLQATDRLRAAFGLISDVRQTLTIWEFRDAIATNLSDLGGQGFVASIGEAIVKGASVNGQQTSPCDKEV